jgi:hypothetical protein
MAMDIMTTGIAAIGGMAILGLAIKWIKGGSLSSFIAKFKKIEEKKHEEALTEIRAKQSDVVVKIGELETLSEEKKAVIQQIAEKAEKKVEEVLKEKDVAKLSQILDKEW